MTAWNAIAPHRCSFPWSLGKLDRTDIRRGRMEWICRKHASSVRRQRIRWTKQTTGRDIRDTLLQFRAARTRNILQSCVHDVRRFFQILKSVCSDNRGCTFIFIVAIRLAAAYRDRANVAHGNEIRLGEERVTRLVVNRNYDFNLFGWWRKPPSQYKCY